MKYNSTERLFNYAYNKGFEYEKKYGGCAQCTIAAIQDIVGEIDDIVFKSATLFGGGTCSQGKGICGGLAGGLMVIGYFIGRDRKNYSKKTSHITAVGKELTDKFIDEYGSFICHDIQIKVFGRKFDLNNMEDRQVFEQMGAHETVCPNIVGKAVQWVLRILLQKEVLLLEDGKIKVINNANSFKI